MQLVGEGLPSSIDRLVVGLGNPGAEYEQTRHNIGFAALDTLAEEKKLKFKRFKKLNAQWALTTIEGKRLLLVKPLTYMNLSGQAVAPLMRAYDLALSDLLVVVDDVTLPLGRVRLRPKGSSGGQNGLKSIIQSLGNQEGFHRLRLAVGPQTEGQPLEDFVLEAFPDEQLLTVKAVCHFAMWVITRWALCPLDTLRNVVNGITVNDQTAWQNDAQVIRLEERSRSQPTL